jgi:serine/threonine protein kinase
MSDDGRSPPSRGCASRAELAALAEGSLTGLEASRLEEHARGCTACATTLRDLSTLAETAATLPDPGSRDETAAYSSAPGPPATEPAVSVRPTEPAIDAPAAPASPSPSLSSQEFVNTVVSSGLVPAEAVAPLTSPADPDARPLAYRLVERGLLTAYQAEMLLQGKGRRLVLGRYVVLDKLGEGGMGMVFAALDRERGARVALKLLPRVDAASLVRFKREFRAHAELVHPNTITLHELIAEGDQWFFTMDIVPGINFLTFVRSPAHSGEALPADSATSDFTRASASAPPETFAPPALDEGRLRGALRQLAEGLVAVHDAGLLHRDLKPSNVMVEPDGHVVILDFGLVTERAGPRDDDPSGATTALSGDLTDARVVGTVDYMAPEQAAGQPPTPAADWYSVGVMLYEALAGRRPFRGRPLRVLKDKQRADPPPLSEIAPDAPADLARLAMELLARDPQARPSGREVLERLGGPAAASEGALRRAPFVGRTAHLDALRAAFLDTTRGRAVTVLVHGQSGAGKSALMQRFLEEIQEGGGAVVLSGRCYEQESVPYKALDGLIDALARYLRRQGPSRLAALLPPAIGALARVFPVLRRVEAIAGAPEEQGSALDQQELRRRAFGALRSLVARIAARQPVILAVDDLQWGDPEGATLLAGLLDPPDAPPVLLIAGYRSEYAATAPALKAFLADRGTDRRELAVEALTDAETRELVLSLLDEPLPARTEHAEAIVRESRGNPFFVLELARHPLSGDELASLCSGSGTLDLDEVIWGRVRRLPETTRRLLEVVAVAGQPIRQREAYQAAGLSGGAAGAESALRSGNLIRRTGPRLDDEVESYHDRIRESVVAHLDPATLRELHRSLAVTLEAAGAADHETLAIHYHGADEPAIAGGYYARAADEAAEALAFDRAATLYQLALDLGGQTPDAPDRLRRKLADALANAGRGLEAARVYRSLAESAAPEQRLELQRLTAFHYSISGHHGEGANAFAEALQTVGLRLPRTPRRLMLGLLVNRAIVSLRGLQFRETPAEQIDPEVLNRIDTCREANLGRALYDLLAAAYLDSLTLRLTLAAGEPYRVALILALHACQQATAGGPGRRQTERLLQEGRKLADRIGNPHALGLVTMATGIREFLEGRFAAAVPLCDQAERILSDRCTGVTWELDSTRCFALWGLLYSGQLAEMRSRFAVLSKDAHDRGDLYAATNLGTQIGALAHVTADDPGQAKATVDELMAAWPRDNFSLQEHNAVLGWNYIDLYEGRGREAWARFEHYWPIYKSSLVLGIQQLRIDVRQSMTRAALGAIDAGAAPGPLLREARRHIRAIERERMPWSDAIALHLRGGLHAAQGDRRAAVLHLCQAVPALEKAGMGLYAAAARRRLGQWLGGPEGRALAARADEWMARQQIRDPDRMTAAFAPGFGPA